MYAAYARKTAGEPYHMVTMGGQLFFASKWLLEDMVAAMEAKHPEADFKIEEVRDA